MLSCPILVGSGGTSKKLIGDFPFTSNIQDVLGNIIATYTSGGTDLTCNNNGFYMYYGSLTFSDFSSFITGDYVEFEMQIQYESSGTSNYPSFRRILKTGLLSCEMNSSYITKIALNVLGGSYLKTCDNSYNDGNYHNLILRYDFTNKTVYIQVDHNEGFLIPYNNLLKTNLFSFNDTRYGLNGCIKNLKIYTGQVVP